MKPTHLRLDAAVSCSIASTVLVPNHGDVVQVRLPFATVVGKFRAVGGGLARAATLGLLAMNFERNFNNLY
jgi:hypothetical protein